MDAAKKKSFSPAGLTALRVLLLLVVTLFLPETRVWGFAATPHLASGQIAVASASAVGEIGFAWQYDASGSLVAAKGTTSLFGSSEYVIANGEQAMQVQRSLLRNYAQNATNPGIHIVEGLTENAQIDTVTGRISLSSDLVENYPHLIDGTVTEELFHFQQLQSSGLFGGRITGAQSRAMEDEVVELMLKSGFKKQ